MGMMNEDHISTGYRYCGLAYFHYSLCTIDLTPILESMNERLVLSVLLAPLWSKQTVCFYLMATGTLTGRVFSLVEV